MAGLFETDYWQTDATSVTIAGLNRINGDIGRKFGEDSHKNFKDRPVYNKRKSFLLEKELVNWLGRGVTPKHIQIDEKDSSLKILDRELSEINDILSGEDLGDLTLINTRSFDKGVSNNTQKDIINKGLKFINPGPVAEVVDHKYKFGQVIDDNLNTIPTRLAPRYAVEGTEAAEKAREYGIEELPGDRREARNYFLRDWGALAEAPEEYRPLIYKPMNGNGGSGVEAVRVEDVIDHIVDEGMSLNSEKGLGGLGVYQLNIPHLSDIRAIAGGSVIATAYERIGRHDIPQTNLDELPDEIYNDLNKIIEGKHANPINLDDKEGDLEGLFNLIADGSESIDSYLEQQGIETENVGQYLGWDALVVDHQHPLFQSYPEEVQEHILDDRYRIPSSIIRGDEIEDVDTDFFYLTIAEANSSPGCRGDDINSYPLQDSKLNLRYFGDCVANDTEFERGGFMD